MLTANYQLLNIKFDKIMGKTSRRVGREYAMRVLYASEMTKDPVNKVINNELIGQLTTEKNQKFSMALINTYSDHIEELDTIIKDKALNWEFNRIAVIDKVLLRIGICELLYFEDIPPKVTINEAIEIAKKYSTEKSGKFVNGILDAILQDLRKSGLLKKSGRGLMDM